METIIASLIAAAGGGKSANLQHNPTLTTNGEHQPLQGYDGFDYVTVAVPVPTEITGSFSENGEYWSPSGRVWNHIIVDVDAELEIKKSYKDITDFFEDDPIPKEFTNKSLTWKTEHFSDTEPRTITFGKQTISNVYAGCILYTWIDGSEFKMVATNVWTRPGSGYVYEGVSNARVEPQEGSTPAKLTITHTYSSGVGQHMTQDYNVTFDLGTELEEMNDSTGYVIKEG
jgi:hypothetical protein